MRRSLLNPFSTQKVVETQGLVKEKMAKLCDILQAKREAGSPINMSRAYRAMTMDVITEYVMTSSYDYLDKLDFDGRWYTMIRNGRASQVLMNQFRWMLPAMQALPHKLAISLVPDAEAALGVQKMNEHQIQDIKDAGPDAAYEKKTRKPLFHEILFKSGLPDPEKPIPRHGFEATLIVIAGSETVGSTLTQLHYQLLASPEKLAKLKHELHEFNQVDIANTKWQELKKLPYLTACIEEILHLSRTTTHRLARFAPKQGLRYQNHFLPAGMNSCPSAGSPQKEAPSKYLNLCSEGPRICLGIDLAYAELYLATAIQSGFATKLFETTKEGVETVHEFFQWIP
ncbi:MAG: hypothetical protein Q9166_002812 [cf. Caloplaca sp. 2 TL-2023]